MGICGARPTSPCAYPRFWFGDDESISAGTATAPIRGPSRVPRALPALPRDDGYTSPAEHYEPNAFSLYGMAGNAWQTILGPALD
jgi:formylglycine-generating enzyme required for sulfatase activity